jgi:hypothetical protein
MGLFQKRKMSSKLLTAEQLKKFDSSDPDEPIYLAVLGRVFDVTRGFILSFVGSIYLIVFRKKHYTKKKGGYGLFAGRDGSRAFVTGQNCIVFPFLMADR